MSLKFNGNECSVLWNGINTTGIYNGVKIWPTNKFYYLTNFSNIISNIDQPAASMNDYKWNLLGHNTTPVGALKTITSVDGTLPSSFIGKTFRRFKRYTTTPFHFPETGNFTFHLWSKYSQRSGAGGFLGVRYHSGNTQALFDVKPNRGSGFLYGLFLQNPSFTYYNGGGYVRDSSTYNAVVTPATNWHFFSIEVDRENNKAYFFSDGIIRMEVSFSTFLNDVSVACFGDSESYDDEFSIAEFAILSELKSSGTGASRTYPMPTEPLIK